MYTEDNVSNSGGFFSSIQTTLPKAKILIDAVVDANPAAVKLNLRNYYKSAKYGSLGNAEVKDLIYKLYKSGYRVDQFLTNVPISASAKSYPAFYAAVSGAGLVETDGMNRGNEKSIFSTIGDVFTALAMGITAGSVVGNVLFPGLTEAGSTPPPINGGSGSPGASLTFGQKIAAFYSDHALLAWGLTVAVVGGVVWLILRAVRKRKK